MYWWGCLAAWGLESAADAGNRPFESRTRVGKDQDENQKWAQGRVGKSVSNIRAVENYSNFHPPSFLDLSLVFIIRK